MQSEAETEDIPYIKRKKNIYNLDMQGSGKTEREKKI